MVGDVTLPVFSHWF